MSPVRALVVMLVVCALGCRAELDLLRCKAFTGAMKNVGNALNCYTQESLQIHRENRNSLGSLSDTVQMLKNQMALENEKTIDSIRKEFQHLFKVEQLTQANGELKTKLTENEKRVEQLTAANEELTTKLAHNGKQVEQLTESNAEMMKTITENNKQVQNLEERQSVSVQQVDNLTENEKRRNSTVQDLNKRLQESELRVQELEKMFQQLNETMDCTKKDPECRQPQLQKIKEVVQRFNVHKNLSQLREDLESTLDSSSEEYQQLRGIAQYKELMYALGHSGHPQLVTLLLCGGLPVDMTDGVGQTMLHGAAGGNDPQMLKLLLEHGAQVDARDSAQYTPLIRAAYQGRVKAVQVLVEAGASTTAKDKYGRTAREAARNTRRCQEVEQYLQQIPH